MSTADCKAMLVEHFPTTKAKDWKRKSKYLNYHETEVREFTHPSIGVAYVVEDYREIRTDPQHFDVVRRETLKAPDFVFSLHESEPMYEGDAKVGMYMTYKHFFETEGHVDSVHLGSIVRPFFPKGIRCDEDMESYFAIREDFDIPTLREMLIAAGFTFSQAFQDLCADNE